MSVYVRFHNLTGQGQGTLRNFKNNLAETRKLQEDMGVKIIASYATLGEYDFVSIVEAPDDETAFKISAAIGAKGSIATKTLKAMPIEEFAELTTKL